MAKGMVTAVTGRSLVPLFLWSLPGSLPPPDVASKALPPVDGLHWAAASARNTLSAQPPPPICPSGFCEAQSYPSRRLMK